MRKSAIVLSAIVLMACNDQQPKTADEAATASAKDSASAQPAATSEENAPAMDSAAMAKAWETYMSPGEMHGWLKKGTGKWKAEFTFWMGADAPPDSGMIAEVETKMILGGRYQESVYKGNMHGMAFEGRGITGYDNAKKKFQSTWVDNMGTGVMFMEGELDKDGMVLKEEGESTDPMTGKTVQMRQTLQKTDENHHVMEMFDNKNGKEYRSMRIKLTRK